MKIETQHIPSKGASLAFRKEAKNFNVLQQMADQGECTFTEPIQIDLMIIAERDLFKLKGLITTTAQMPCSRCLVAYDLPIQHKFTLRFSNQIPADLHINDDDQIELTADQIGLIYFEGEQIDLQEPIQEQVVLSLPFKPLCSDNCKGLCQRCGADLNVKNCACDKERSNSPFSVLTQRQWPSKSQEK